MEIKISENNNVDVVNEEDIIDPVLKELTENEIDLNRYSIKTVNIQKCIDCIKDLEDDQKETRNDNSKYIKYLKSVAAGVIEDIENFNLSLTWIESNIEILKKLEEDNLTEEENLYKLEFEKNIKVIHEFQRYYPASDLPEEYLNNITGRLVAIESELMQSRNRQFNNIMRNLFKSIGIKM